MPVYLRQLGLLTKPKLCDKCEHNIALISIDKGPKGINRRCTYLCGSCARVVAKELEEYGP